MTQEIVVAAGIIASLVGVLWTQTNRRINDHSKKFEQINSRCMLEVGSIATVIEQNKGLDKRMARMEQKFDELTIVVKKNGH